VDITLQLHRIRQGDRAAFAPVVLHFQGPLFHYLGRMGLGAAVAQEIAQETFLRAWSHLAEFDPQRAQFSTWLFTLARHLALHALDKAAHQHEHSAGDDLPDVASPAPGPADALQAAQRRARLQQALRTLSVQDRSALALAYFQELDMAAIARIENCSVAAIKVRLHRAKQRLREQLETPHA
jgi:RNA polymerase sigma-70 factor, ECF subfamily